MKHFFVFSSDFYLILNYIVLPFTMWLHVREPCNIRVLICISTSTICIDVQSHSALGFPQSANTGYTELHRLVDRAQ